MAKYKEFYDLMVTQNKETFDDFKDIHDKYLQDPKKWYKEFNKIGSDVQDLMREYENRLCRASEGAGNSKFTTALSEKFQGEVKKNFSKINFIGMEY